MLIENIREALRNLAANKSRSFLTMLGIIIGISAVITISTIGESIRSTLSATMNSLGGNTISVSLDAVYPEDEAAWEYWEYPALDEEDRITTDMVREVCDAYPDEIAGYTMDASLYDGRIEESADRYANVYVNGATEIQLDYMRLELVRGRNITTRDIDEMKRVCIISDQMAGLYFPDEDPIGKQVEFVSQMYGTTAFTVVGVYEYNEAVFGYQDSSVPLRDRSTPMFIPVSTALDIIAKSSESDPWGFQYCNFFLQIGADPILAQSEIESYFDEKYADNEDWQIYTFNSSDFMDEIYDVIDGITWAISLIAAISLVVGGVGVMNIMLVSVTERTREIGVRKAIGAKNRTIRQLFLIEAIVLCVIGSLVGIGIGLLLGTLFSHGAQALIAGYSAGASDYFIMQTKPPIRAILLSVGFSVLIGVFFGYYPAKKASKLQVIDALRYE